MATISPNGRFLAAAAFTADVKVGNSLAIFSNSMLPLERYVWVHMFVINLRIDPKELSSAKSNVIFSSTSYCSLD